MNIKYGLLALVFLGYRPCITASKLSEKYSIVFDDAMQHSKHYSKNFAQRDQNWKTLKDLYETAINSPYDSAKGFNIPPVFHLIWLGSLPPHRYTIIAKRLKELHPRAKIKLWTDKEANAYKLRNRKAYSAATNYGEKSDILRYEILYDEGGVYIDGDFDVLKCFDDLLYACTFFTGIAYNSKVELYNGLIGAVPHHPILKSCIDTLKTGGPKNDPNAILDRSGPYHFTRNFLKMVKTSPGITVAFPVGFFYPWPNYDRFNAQEANIKKYIKPYSFALHRWAASWVK